MASRKRDHKAEYQRRKQLARQRGFVSVRQYKTARKTQALPRSQPIVNIAGIRAENKEWSDEHSRLETSKWNPRLSDRKAIAYHNAFVVERVAGPDKLAALYDYLVEYDLVSEDEWSENYLPSK